MSRAAAALASIRALLALAASGCKEPAGGSTGPFTPGDPTLLSVASRWTLTRLSTRSGDPKVFDLALSDRDRYPTGVARNDAFPNAYSPRISKAPRAGVYIAVWVQGPEGAQDVYSRIFQP